VKVTRETRRRSSRSGAVEDMYPLSPLQEGMLFHSLYDPRAGEHVEQVVCRLRGELDPAAFRSAWEEVVDRHPALRSGFVWRQRDEPFQVVFRRVEIPWREEDWRGAGDGGGGGLDGWLDDDRRAGFELSRPPLHRFLLAQVSEDEWIFVWTHHHLLLDGWSLPLVLEEVFAAYRAHRRGAATAPPVARRPYRDFIRWLARHRSQAGEGTEFWRSYLAGWRQPTPLPAAPPGGGSGEDRETRRGGELVSDLSAHWTRRMGEVAARHRVTPSTLLQAAWALLLGQYGNSRDVVFGAVFAARPPELEGVESMIGMFLNTLPVRVHFDPEDSAADLWGRLAAVQLDLRQHLYTPLSRVGRHAELPAGAPMFETAVVFENYPLSDLPAPEGLEVIDARVVERTNFPFVLVGEPGERLRLSATFDPDRVTPVAARRLLSQVGFLLRRMVEAPETSLAELGKLSAAERHQLLREWPDGGPSRAEGRGAFAIFAHWAARHPEAHAVVCGGAELSYGELQKRSLRLAGHLRRLGVGHGTRVAILVEPSTDLPVAVLAALAAGACYLPLDPATPEQRLASMLDGAGVAAILTQRRLARRLASPATPVVLLDEPPAGGTPPHLPVQAPHPDAAAYVIHTSGSTGRPKGVVVSHRGLENLLTWHRRRGGIGPGDRVAQVSGLGFDASVWDTWAALGSGATLHVAHGEQRRSPEPMHAWMVDAGISVAFLPTPLLELMLEHWRAGGGPPPSLRYLATGGDRLLSRPQADLGVPLLNAYGPAEAAVVATAGRVAPAAPGLPAPAIGRAVDGARVLLLDRRLEPTPLGALGEVCVAGAGVGRGYLGEPAATAERFQPDPHGPPGSRLYRTGDLARWSETGELDFAGRADHQVQIHGVRVEPDEVAAVLADHPSVGRSVVVPVEGGAGNRRLVAFVTPRSNGVGFDAAALLRDIAPRLPEAMVPVRVVELEDLPLTASGKVDRDALTSLAEDSFPLPEGAAAVPDTPLEEQLAALWAEILGTGPVSPDDDFFQLGGDSILSLRLVSRAHRAGIRLSPRQIFRNRTLAELTASIAAEPGAGAIAAPVTGELPLSPIQRWFFESDPVDPEHWNHAIMLRVPARVPAAVWPGVVRHLLARHDVLRARFLWRDGAWQGWLAAPRARPPHGRIDLAALPVRRRRSALERAAASLQRGLPLRHGPLLRSVLFDLAPGTERRLLVVIHHLAVDLVSWHLLLGDTEAALVAVAEGEPPATSPKGTSVRRWVERLQEWAAGGGPRDELDHWRAAVGPALVLAPAVPGEADLEGAARVVEVRLASSELGDLATAPGRRLEAALVTAAARAVRSWSGRRETVRFDLESHGRPDMFAGVDVSRTVGWFTALYPFAVPAAGEEMGPAEELVAVEQALTEVPNRGVGYGVLRYLGGDGELAEALRPATPTEIRLGYAGRGMVSAVGAASALGRAPESPGPTRSPRARRRHRLEIDARWIDDELHVDLAYGGGVFAATAAEDLAAGLGRELRAMAPNGGDTGDVDRPPRDQRQDTDEESLRAFGEVKL